MDAEKHIENQHPDEAPPPPRETTSSLPRQMEGGGGGGGDQEEAITRWIGRGEIVKEVKRQLLLAGPLVSLNFLLYFIHVISIMLVGHLGQLQLSGASLGTAFASITGVTLLRGLGSALETFSGQSFGAKQYHMLGVHLQRGLIVLLLATIPIAAVFANAESIMRFFRQDPQISAEAGRYVRFLILSLPGAALMECHIRFLQMQNNVVPLMVSSGITTALHTVICWTLVFKTGLGYIGAAITGSLSFWISAVLLIGYVWTSPKCKETWHGFSKEAFREIPKFLKLAIPSTIMLSLEVWSLEVLILLSGLLPNPKLETSVMSISSNIYLLVHGIPLGLGCAVSTRVSNKLGAGRPRAAKLAVGVAAAMVVTEGIIVAAIMISTHNVLGYLYSKEKLLVKYVGKMLLLVAASHFFDGIQSVLSGTCRGCGRQKIGTVINLGAYYLVGIPCMAVLAFVSHIGGKGLWIGFVLALFVQATSFTTITLLTNWEKQAQIAKDRASISDSAKESAESSENKRVNEQDIDQIKVSEAQTNTGTR